MEKKLNEILSVRQLADHLGLHEQTVYSTLGGRRKLELPQGFKVGRAWRWRREVVDQWIAAREIHISQADHEAKNPARGRGRPRKGAGEILKTGGVE